MPNKPPLINRRCSAAARGVYPPEFCRRRVRSECTGRFTGRPEALNSFIYCRLRVLLFFSPWSRPGCVGAWAIIVMGAVGATAGWHTAPGRICKCATLRQSNGGGCCCCCCIAPWHASGLATCNSHDRPLTLTLRRASGQKSTWPAPACGTARRPDGGSRSNRIQSGPPSSGQEGDRMGRAWMAQEGQLFFSGRAALATETGGPPPRTLRACRACRASA